MKKRIIIVVVLLALVIIATIIYNWSRNSAQIQLTTGTIEALEVDVRNKISDRIDTLYYQEGDTVAKGEILGRFEGEEIESMVKRAETVVAAQKAVQREIESNLRDSEKLLAKTKSLKEVGGVSNQQVEDIELRLSVLNNKKEAQLSLVQQAVESLHIARENEKEIKITSPIKGTIISRNFEEGELVPPGASIFTIADFSFLWVNIYLSLEDVENIKLMQTAYVKLDAYPEMKFKGRIIHISNKAEFTPKTVLSKKNRESLVFKVKVKLDSGFDILKPGLPAIVIIPVKKR